VDVRNIPEALPYFITPKAVDDNSVLLQQLPHWAPCSITQALEFLTPAYKGHPRVMAYVLRVLESYPPERVTFFMPQLVQTLRHDDGVRYLLKLKLMVYSRSSQYVFPPTVCHIKPDCTLLFC
jgi:phosphatidylinositol 4-kinase